MDIHLLIQHENALLLPAVAEGVTLTLERKNTPGLLIDADTGEGLGGLRRLGTS